MIDIKSTGGYSVVPIAKNKFHASWSDDQSPFVMGAGSTAATALLALELAAAPQESQREQILQMCHYIVSLATAYGVRNAIKVGFEREGLDVAPMP